MKRPDIYDIEELLTAIPQGEWTPASSRVTGTTEKDGIECSGDLILLTSNALDRKGPKIVSNLLKFITTSPDNIRALVAYTRYLESKLAFFEKEDPEWYACVMQNKVEKEE